MPAHKRQHYVPRCYLRPFSLDAAGVAINLFNISRANGVQNAAVKGQCARDYLYGEDLKLEKLLQDIEGEYGRILKILQVGDRELSDPDQKLLRFFSFLQHQRTEMAVRRLRLTHLEVRNATYEGRSMQPEDIDLSDRALMRKSMFQFVQLVKQIDDLKFCLVENETRVDFVTTDDPAIFTNRFHFQKLQTPTFGLASSGALLFMPLTPRFLAVWYDGNVYTVSDKKGDAVAITKEADVLAANELQYLKAAENLYFAEWDNIARVTDEFKKFQSQRPESWCDVQVFVPNGVDERGEKYRPASEVERKSAKEILLSIRQRYPSPSSWLSILKYRNPPRTYTDGSAAGYLRPTSIEANRATSYTPSSRRTYRT